MKAQFLKLSAAGLLLAAATSFATAAELQPVPRRTQAQADRLLSAAGVDVQAQSVSVRASIDPDGRVTGVNVLRSSGSRETDRVVEAVLKRVIRADPPLGLTDGTVTLTLAGPSDRADAR
jgi:TonB family protein